MHSPTNGSSADDYRSVIDDLTIENKKLREKLRRYETSHSSHLEKDKLFEVKVHGLSSKKKRELEETLRVFATSLDSFSDPSRKNAPVRGTRHHLSGESSQNLSSSSTSNSLPVDSAYASMSNSGPTSASATNCNGFDQKLGSQSRRTKESKVQSFLHDIPEGLMPKHSIVMTERQKRKVVVRRLEQLFTGKTGAVIGEHSQSMQQQEVARSAAMADRAAEGGMPPAEGHRQAHILPYEMEIDGSRPGKLAEDTSNETELSRGPFDAAEASSDNSPSDQRPTRPLDIDPDRAQIPSDNFEYIRHLGLSQSNLEDHLRGGADADGWIYLNLLVNMAQLHIINVTPDFVRSAVTDVSEKLQLSRDGKKVRWRGGTEGTRLSSDSDASSTRSSSHDSDSLDGAERKRRRTEVGRFASVPIDSRVPWSTVPPNSFHYKPLLYHRVSSSEEFTSLEDSDSPFDRATGKESGENGIFVREAPSRSRGSQSELRGKRKRNDGPIIFYHGAHFCTDLSGDRGSIDTPLHVTGVGKDGYSNHTQDAIGWISKDQAPLLNRTLSGSTLPFRPFKDYSKVSGFLETNETRAKTPELLTEDVTDLDFPLEWSDDQPISKAPLQDFDASGLGGTQPADHFAVKVETRRTRLDSDAGIRLSKFSSPGSSFKRFIHTIPKAALDIFRSPETQNSADIITSKLASLYAFNSPSHEAAEELPVKSRFVSAQFSRLEPSALPAPMGYYCASSEESSDSGSSPTSEMSAVRQDRSFTQRSLLSSSDQAFHLREEQESNDTGTDSSAMDEDEDDDLKSSFDMLASARKVNPQIVKQKNKLSRETHP